MDTQHGYRVHRWGGPLQWEELPRGTPGPHEVLVRVEACGVGLTVLNCMNGDLADDPGLLPRVPGHELVGRVAAVGAGVDRSLVGRRVVAYFYLACGACPPCVAGQDARCLRLAGWVGVHRDGGYAPWTVLPARNVVPVGDELDPVAATVVPDAVATPVHVCGSRAGVRPGDRVAVIGAGGGVGIHLVQVARLWGADVAGLDVHDDKLNELEGLGVAAVASHDLPALDPGLWREGGPTVVVDLVGTPASLRWSLDALVMGGRLVALTTFRDRFVDLSPRELVLKEASVLGSRYATRAEVAQAAALVAAGRVRPVIGRTVAPAQVPAVHEQLRDGTLVGRGALRWPESPDA